MSWKTVRIALLLLILGAVALDMVLEDGRLRSWDHPLRVVIYPINGDGSPSAQRHVERLTVEPLQQLERYLLREARRHGLTQTAMAWVDLAPEIKARPPALPTGASRLSVMRWSLQLRYWMWRHDSYQGLRPELRVLAIYYDPALTPSVPHSTGLTKGRLALAHVFAGNDEGNNVVIVHELLHTLGATDKYEPGSGLPSYPEGYAEPQREPRYPQRSAEIMGGRVPQSPTQATIPASVGQTQVGALTASEIGWR